MHYLLTAAETLLAEWEAQAQPVRSPDYPANRAQLLRQFTPMCAVLVNPQSDVNVDEDDVRTVLRHASSLRVGSAGSSGPGRALRAARQAAATALAHHLGPQPAGQATMALLAIISQPAAELEMDELTAITEYFQQTLGNQQLEVIFGHGQQPGLPTELWVGLLATYCPRPLLPAPVCLLQLAPLEIDVATGRDFYFEVAARLFVQRGRATGSLLQHHFSLSHHRTARLLDELAAAGIIAPAAERSGWRLLVADEVVLNGVLCGGYSGFGNSGPLVL